MDEDAQQAHDAAHRPYIAWHRAEQDDCQRGTPGCCIDHVQGRNERCETW